MYCPYGTYSDSIIFPKSSSRPRISSARGSNPHLIFQPSETVKRVRIRFENIRKAEQTRKNAVRNLCLRLLHFEGISGLHILSSVGKVLQWIYVTIGYICNCYMRDITWGRWKGTRRLEGQVTWRLVKCCVKVGGGWGSDAVSLVVAYFDVTCFTTLLLENLLSWTIYFCEKCQELASFDISKINFETKKTWPWRAVACSHMTCYITGNSLRICQWQTIQQKVWEVGRCLLLPV